MSGIIYTKTFILKHIDNYKDENGYEDWPESKKEKFNKFVIEVNGMLSDLDNELEEITYKAERLDEKLCNALDKIMEMKSSYFPIKTMNDEEKLELFLLAAKKYTLTELENKLGNKFDLI